MRGYLRRRKDLKKLWLLLGLTVLASMAFVQARPKAKLIADPTALYEAYNEMYFLGALPKGSNHVLISAEEISCGIEEKCYGQTSQISRHQYVIQISPIYNDTLAQEEETMLHEMCHIRVWESHPDLDAKNAHGYEWQSCMVNLADHGAMADIW